MMSASYYALILEAAKSMSKPPPKTPELQLHKHGSDDSPLLSTEDEEQLFLTQNFDSPNVEYPLTQHTPTSSASEAETTIQADNTSKKRKGVSSSNSESSSDSSVFSSSVFNDYKTPKDTETRKVQKMFFTRACSINFSRVCPHCKQTICDGTTLTTFIYNRSGVTEETKYMDAKGMFLKTYLLVKDFELFQQTRYSDPDKEYKDEMLPILPLCVRKAFNNSFDSGESTFNQCRRRLKEMSSEEEESDSSSQGSTDSSL